MTEIKYVSADQSKIFSHADGVAIVLEALGHPEAAVSDESLIWDFLPHCKWLPEEEEELRQSEIELLNRLSLLVDRPVTADDYIWELAQEIQSRRN